MNLFQNDVYRITPSVLKNVTSADVVKPRRQCNLAVIALRNWAKLRKREVKSLLRVIERSRNQWTKDDFLICL